jgi:large subunit ribosomal protein L30
MPQLEITQVRSLIGAKADQRATVRSLGLRKLHQTVVQPDRPEIRGMVSKVAHLVRVRYAGAAEEVDLQPGQVPHGEGAPAAAPSVPDDQATALAEAEAEALAEPGHAAPGSVIEHPAGLHTVDAPDAPEPIPDAAYDARPRGVETPTGLPRAERAPVPAPPPEKTGPKINAPEVVDEREAQVVPREALADPRGELDEAVAAGDLPPEEAERAREELAEGTDTVGVPVEERAATDDD